MGIQPTDNIEQAKRSLDLAGCAVLSNVLTSSEVVSVRERLFAAIDSSEADGVSTRNYAFDPDPHNIRIFHLFNLDPIFVELIQRPTALEFVRYSLGDSFLISNFSANITEPGNAAMQLHADQGYVLPPWPDMPLACNVAWLLDDFTVENGGTRYVPGSHLLGHGPDPDVVYPSIPIEAPAGSLLIMDGRLWHQTGTNRSADQRRAALFGYYVLRWLRSQMNWNTMLWPETIASLEPAFLDLLGYYTGNVEYQIAHGRRASVRPPATLTGSKDPSFALGPQQSEPRARTHLSDDPQ